jgi:hypothetical protein
MPVQDSINFIKALKSDKCFRDNLFECENSEQIQILVEDSGYKFNIDEFKQAYNMLLLRCQISEEASILNDVCNSYLLILGLNPVFY